MSQIKETIRLSATGKKRPPPFTEEHRRNMGESRRGRHHSEEAKKKMSLAKKGRKLSFVMTEEIRRKISEGLKGEKCYNWKGGASKQKDIIRAGIEHRLWREAVFARDNWICQKTGMRGVELNVHHIKNFAQYPELRFAIDNGITLSKKAHQEFHKKYGTQDNTREQIEEFLGKKLDNELKELK